MPTSIIGRAVALVAGVIFTAGALAILLEEVVLGSADFALKHGLTVVIVSGTMLTGHLVVEAWRSRHFLGALGFAVLFLTGTALVVYKSTGRQAEHTFQSQAEADFAAEERARIKPLLAQAEAMHSGTAKKLADDCVNGKRGKGHCDGLRATLTVYDAAVKGHKADLDRLGAPKPVAPEAENFAALAAVFGADKAKIKAGSLLVVPFVQTILFELGGIWCLGFAFRHRPATRKAKATGETVTTQPRQPLPIETAQTDFYADDIEATRSTIIGDDQDDTDAGNGGNSGNPSRPKGGNGGGNRQAFEADVLTRLALGQTIECQDDLALAHGVNKGTVSKWLKDMRRRDLIPAAQRVGRCHRLVAAD
ncbi:hypothetical protein [Hyphomicrobium sp. CS1GBMeth3]|uniref:hypothetical protein n=1 Tax=Hyphomicrobium sp. CS1GBMeth3 TaxID=1892845 RepID=UPI0009304867|nr:hypothetical protein [Hyphomicrobium sp. CS1GBMeth3]